MDQNTNYLATWKEYCEEAGIDYDENAYLEPFWDSSQDKIFGFILKLLI